MKIIKQRVALINIICMVLIAFLASVYLTKVSASEEAINGIENTTAVSSNGVRYKRGELLVKFRPNVAAQLVATISESHGAVEVKGFRKPRSLSRSPMDQWRLIKLGTGVDTEAALGSFANEPDVEHVEFNYVYTAAELIPNDPRFSDQWGLHNIGQTGGTLDADIDAPEAWDTQTGSSDVVVAVIDTGVDYTHEDLAANIWTNPGEIPDNRKDDDHNGYKDDVHGWDFANDDNDPFDDRGHGTRVSGVIAAKGNNGIGVAGVTWDVKIMALKFLNANGTGFTSDAVKSVLYSADMGASVMNNSWGGGSYSKALFDAISTANEAGALFIAAAGNSSNDNDEEPHYPSNYDVENVIAVAATDDDDELASFSNYGLSSVDLGAPGVSILSTSPADTYSYSNGTSYATPYVSGAAALVMADKPSFSHLEVKEQLLSTVDSVPSLAGKTVTGGRLNVSSALGETPSPDNMAPEIINIEDKTVTSNSTVILDVVAYDPDGDSLSYVWQQIAGSPPVILENADTNQAFFVAPNVGAKPKEFVFEVTVTDTHGASVKGQSTITVIRE